MGSKAYMMELEKYYLAIQKKFKKTKIKILTFSRRHKTLTCEEFSYINLWNAPSVFIKIISILKKWICDLHSQEIIRNYADK